MDPILGDLPDPDPRGAWRGPPPPGRTTLEGMSEPVDRSAAATPFLELDRDAWAALAPQAANPLTDSEIVRLRGLGDSLDPSEVSDVYVPLRRLLTLYAVGARAPHRSTRDFLGP